MQRNLLVGIIVVVLLIFATIYFFFLGGRELIFKSVPEQQPKAPITTAPGRPGDASKFFALTQKKVSFPILSHNQEAVWYFDESGQLYRNTLDGKSEESFGLPLTSPIKEALWPPAGNDFIVRVGSSTGGRDIFRFYKSAAARWVDLPANIEEMAWLPDGQKVIYIWRRADGGRELKIANADSTDFSTVLPLSESFKLEASPKDNFVLLIEPLPERAVSKALKVDLGTKQVSELLDRGRNLDALFSAEGSALLFVRINEESSLPELWLHDFAENSFKNLGLTTAISKVAWNKAGAGFYYGLPRQVTPGDFELTSQTSDKLYFYNLKDGQTSEINFPQAGQVDIRDVLVTDKEDMVLFRGGQDGKLYRLNLK